MPREALSRDYEGAIWRQRVECETTLFVDLELASDGVEARVSVGVENHGLDGLACFVNNAPPNGVSLGEHDFHRFAFVSLLASRRDLLGGVASGGGG
jgi:hypothetical protein